MLAAGLYTRILLLLPPFHAVAIRHTAALLGTGRIKRVGRIRRAGRVYGLVFFAVLLVRAVVARWM